MLLDLLELLIQGFIVINSCVLVHSKLDDLILDVRVLKPELSQFLLKLSNILVLLRSLKGLLVSLLTSPSQGWSLRSLSVINLTAWSIDHLDRTLPLGTWALQLSEI
jgi:hypothetical protein